MKNVKIVTSKVSRLGNILILPEIGETEIGKDGVVEVPANVAKHLVEKGLDWAYKGKAPKEEVKKEKAAPAAEEKEEEKAEELDLTELKLTELKDICKNAELPKAEWSGFRTKKDAIAYIESKK